MKVKLIDDLKYIIGNSELILYVPTKGTYRVNNLSSENIQEFSELLQGKEVDKPSSFLLRLIKLDLLKKDIPEEDSFLNRTENWVSNFGLNAQEKFQNLLNSHICILGCGGIGSIVFQQLLQIGFKNFTLIDSSTVNQADLNRQNIFSKSDLGLLKVSCCANYANKEFEISDIRAFNTYIDSRLKFSSILSITKPTMIFCCIDQPFPDYKTFVTESTLNTDIAIIHCEVGVYEAFIGPLLFSNFEKIKYINAMNDTKENLSFIPINKSSISFTNSLSASMMTQIGFNFLFRDDRSKSFYRYDFINMNIHKLDPYEIYR